jgi:hypothetical protein
MRAAFAKCFFLSSALTAEDMVVYEWEFGGVDVGTKFLQVDLFDSHAGNLIRFDFTSVSCIRIEKFGHTRCLWFT